MSFLHIFRSRAREVEDYIAMGRREGKALALGALFDEINDYINNRESITIAERQTCMAICKMIHVALKQCEAEAKAAVEQPRENWSGVA